MAERPRPACLVCEHLLFEPAQGFEVRFGDPRSPRPALLCSARCAAAPSTPPGACDLEHWQAVLARGEWDGSGGEGTPWPETMSAVPARPPHAKHVLEGASPDDLLAAHFSGDTLFLLLAERGTHALRRFTLEQGGEALTQLPDIALDPLIDDETFWGADPEGQAASFSLHVSACHRYLCVTQRFRSSAVLLDLLAPEKIRALDRGTYCVQVSAFPAAFARHGEEAVLVAASDWNRVDVYRARDGELLTAREFLPVEGGDEDETQHDLDYFYGLLATSPQGRWVISSGWCWHPVGVVTYWQLQRWLDEDLFESEDGATRRDPHALVDDDWNRSIVFLDEDRILIWGIYDDAFSHSPGLMLYDLAREAVCDLIAVPQRICQEFVGEGDAAWLLDEGGEVWRLNLTSHRFEAHHPGLGAIELLAPGVALCTQPEVVSGAPVLEIALLGPQPRSERF